MVVDIMYECVDICEHEFDVEVELGMSGLRVNYRSEERRVGKRV